MLVRGYSGASTAASSWQAVHRRLTRDFRNRRLTRDSRFPSPFFRKQIPEKSKQIRKIIGNIQKKIRKQIWKKIQKKTGLNLGYLALTYLTLAYLTLPDQTSAELSGTQTIEKGSQNEDDRFLFDFVASDG